MNQRVHAWIDEQAVLAEESQSCLVPRTQAKLKRLQRAAERGYLVEVAPSVFARTDYWCDLKPARRMCHIMAALQTLHPSWVFAGPSAAVAWGMPVSNRYLDKVWVATSRKAHAQVLDYRRSIIVTGVEPTTKGGLSLTPLARTVGDCLRIMDFRAGLAVADSSLRLTGASKEALAQDIASQCKRMTGSSRMRAIVGLADARAESGGESIARATMLELGLAIPDLQLCFDDPLAPGEEYRVDFAWSAPQGRFIVGELDGFEKYESPAMRRGRTVGQVIEDEHRRQTHLEACPEVVRVVRFGFSDIMHDSGFLELLVGCGVSRSFAFDKEVVAAGGVLRCRV